MKIAMFYHSVVSDWNHGNAHFLRGIATELVVRGHEVIVYEPADAWSYQNLLAEGGDDAVEEFKATYPLIRFARYAELDPASMLEAFDLVIVHEWNRPEVVSAIGEWRARQTQARALFHDTHHRAVTAPHEIEAFDLRHYDGVLAYGDVLRRIYLEQGYHSRVWTWHEAADTRVFQPLNHATRTHDLVWIGNWGDDERTAELHEFLIEPCRSLRLKAVVYGVRYPDHAQAALADAGIEYRGWLPNFRVPKAFAQAKVTVHVPRRPYVKAMPGIPTIRPFEALACGIPLVSAPWPDAENLFRPGTDFLVANSGKQMTQHLQDLLGDEEMAKKVAENGRETILHRHTCAHRVDELLAVCEELQSPR